MPVPGNLMLSLASLSIKQANGTDLHADKTLIQLKKIKKSLGWKDSSVVKSTDCSCRGPGFSSQYPQMSVTPVPRDLVPSAGLHRHQAHKW